MIEGKDFFVGGVDEVPVRGSERKTWVITEPREQSK